MTLHGGALSNRGAINNTVRSTYPRDHDTARKRQRHVNVEPHRNPDESSWPNASHASPLFMTDLQNWKNSSPLCDPARHFLFLRRESDRPVHSSSVRNSNLCGYGLSRDVFIAPTSVPATVEFQQIKTQCGNLLAQQIALTIVKRYSVCSCKRSSRDQI